jgi:hypothetical protein
MSLARLFRSECPDCGGKLRWAQGISSARELLGQERVAEFVQRVGPELRAPDSEWWLCSACGSAGAFPGGPWETL